MKPSVGRGHVPAACRNYQVCTDLFMRTVCCFAVLGDMSQPYIGCFVYRGAFFACGLRGRLRPWKRSRSRGTSVTDAAYLLRVQFPCVGLYAVGSSCTRLPRLVPRLAMTDGEPFRVIAMKPFVGRGHVPAAVGTTRRSISSFMRTVCRFAVLGDMSQPYIGCFVYRGAFFACGLLRELLKGNILCFVFRASCLAIYSMTANGVIFRFANWTCDFA